MYEKVRVIIYMEGGCITSIHAGAFVEVVVSDEDGAGKALVDPWRKECDADWAEASQC